MASPPAACETVHPPVSVELAKPLSVELAKPRMSEPLKLYESSHEFQHDWGVVTSAWLRKFPDPSLKQVRSVETVSRSISEDGNEMQLRRLFHCSFSLPHLLGSIVGIREPSVVCVEESFWDMRQKRLVIRGRNDTLKRLVQIDEVCRYDEVAPGRTLYTQTATVSYSQGVVAGLLMPLARQIGEAFCKRHAQKGICAMVDRIEKLDGVDASSRSDPRTAAAPASALDVEPAGRVVPVIGGLALAAAGLWASRLLRPSFSVRREE